MTRSWTADDVLDLARSYQSACVLAAAAELDLPTALGDEWVSSEQVAQRLGADRRAITVLLDALVALELLEKYEARYVLPSDLRPLLRADGVLPMVQHQANCLRRWAQLAQVVESGTPAPRTPSQRGEQADEAAFIGAMHTVSAPIAGLLVRDLQPLRFDHLLDIGGASGSWTIEFLRGQPAARATLFDLPSVIPLARERLTRAGVIERVDLVTGDYLADPLPSGADLAWLSAIVHQNSREQNRSLLRALHQALLPGGQVLIRDVVMEDSRSAPAAGALFAVNMLVATEGGGTYTITELTADFEAAGFIDVQLARRDEGMNSIVRAHKP